MAAVNCGSIAAVTENARKLLIVEDDPGIQSQLRWCFEDYEVISATDRETAIVELRSSVIQWVSCE